MRRFLDLLGGLSCQITLSVTLHKVLNQRNPCPELAGNRKKGPCIDHCTLESGICVSLGESRSKPKNDPPSLRKSVWWQESSPATCAESPGT